MTREQARELLQVPDRSKLKGKRDYCILAVLVGCALRRQELASLFLENIPTAGRPMGNRRSARQGWSSPDRCRPDLGEAGSGPLDGCGRDRRRPAAAVCFEFREAEGRGLSDWAVWSVVEQSAKQIGIERFGAHDLRRTCAKLCRKAGGDLEQIKFLLGHSSIQTTERYLGSEQEIVVAVNDSLGL